MMLSRYGEAAEYVCPGRGCLFLRDGIVRNNKLNCQSSQQSYTHSDEPTSNTQRRSGHQQDLDQQDPDQDDDRVEGEEGEDELEDEDELMDVDQDGDQDGIKQLSKNLVRYSLSCQHSRTLIRRDAVKDKVLGPSNARKFKQVFEETQKSLRNVFGMELYELPMRDHSHLSAAERKKKVASQAQPKSTNAWILRPTLPPEYRVPAIITPAKAPTAELESSYVGFYTFLIASITIAGGQITHSKLDRILTRMNANINTPMGRTADVLVKLQRQGYIDKITDKNQGEDDKVNYIVGPRGKAEIPMPALAKVIREIYGNTVNDPEFEERLAISLGLPRLGAASRSGGETEDRQE
ncbi:hypothetical protein MKZ38_002443 [Zalerion maritima]|uniref:MAGE domain-containing protein n=1 Tax=Zalerion maritima TaxID=339359 RepID=A0AAD5WQU3_9PEZI|nr:hypothetical protein MKZ38_002443 [Zalerion maritima]